MSELAEFIEESVEPEETVLEETPEVVEEAVEAEVGDETAKDETEETTPEAEEQEGLPTEPDKKEADTVPLAAVMAEREKRQALSKEVEELRQKLTTQQIPTTTETPVMPTLESVGYDEAKYAEEVSKFYAAQVETQFKEREIKAAQERENQEISTKLNDFNTRGLTAHGEEYKALVIENDLLPVTAEMRDTFLDAENGPEVILELAKGGQLERISNLSTTKQIAEVARLCERARVAKKSAPPIEKVKPEVPQSITALTAQGGNQKVEQVIPDPLETTFNR